MAAGLGALRGAHAIEVLPESTRYNPWNVASFGSTTGIGQPRRRPGFTAAFQKRASIKAKNVRRHRLAMKRRGGK